MSELSNALGSVAGGVAGGPLSAVGTVLAGVNDIIGKFITDPNQKLAAQQHALDLQAQLQAAAMDAETKQTQSANDAAKNDHYLWGARAFFCYGFTALYLFVYSGIAAKLIHSQPPEIPMNLNFIFAGVMLGCIGIPAGLEAMKTIMAMPGESSVTLPGFKASNKT
jgi:hypothetical protein